MNRSVAVGVAVVLLLGAGVAPAVAGENPAESRLTTPEGFSQTTFTIQVFANGTAEWTFEYSRTLDNESEREQFRAFAREFERNESTMYRDFVDRSRTLVRQGANVTGRNMTASNFDRAAYVDEFTSTRGVVELSFHWSNFAVVENETVRVGDVFEGGLYVASNQQLVFERGPTLAFTRVSPDSYTLSGDALESSDTITWVGEQRFTDNHPSVVLRPASSVGATTTDPGGASYSNGDMLLLVGLFVVVVGLVGAAVWQSGALQRGGTLTDDGAAAATAETDSSAEDAAAGGFEEEELLSDSDRVVRLLEENGGRMKQVKIVDETDWSKSKVSMLLSEMEEEDEISKLRVGRENIISLSGHEPDAAGSPFEDEQ